MSNETEKISNKWDAIFTGYMSGGFFMFAGKLAGAGYAPISTYLLYFGAFIWVVGSFPMPRTDKEKNSWIGFKILSLILWIATLYVPAYMLGLIKHV
jgi:hypothetical protein